MSARNIVLVIGVLAVAHLVWAGGPLLVGGPKFGSEGQPFVWDNSVPIRYTTDGGTLGSWDNGTANAHVAAAFAVWGSVPTAKLAFQRIGPINGVPDVTTVEQFDQVLGSCQSGTQTPIIYDTDGSLFTQLTDPNVIGFSSPCLLTSAGKIQTAFTALNGTATNLMDSTMVHEFGHLLGLDHTQLNCRATGCAAEDIANTPIMFPIILSNTASLATDDKAWISKLYPNPLFSTQYGTITGRVLFSDGISPVQDGVVIARQVPHSPAAVADQSAIVAVSGLSGYRFTGNPGQPYSADYLPCNAPSSACKNGYLGNNTDGDQFGSRDASLIGMYELPVPPGTYTLEVRTIGNGYTYNDIGPVDIIIDLPGPEEFWNANESATDNQFLLNAYDLSSLALDTVTVTAGGTTSGIDFILNGTAPTADDFDLGALLSAMNWPTPGNISAWLRPLNLPTASLLAGGKR
ncbi:MAG: hypothetical protein ABSG52_13235 [Terriglobales bacterium]|jgi:hypothetical protein